MVQLVVKATGTPVQEGELVFELRWITPTKRQPAPGPGRT
jgi:hypothetical protein